LTPKICVSILPKTKVEALHLIKQAEDSGANLIEVRLDALEDTRILKEIVSCGKLQKIATDKNPGATEIEKKHILLSAAKSGFAYVDVDLQYPSMQDLIKEVKASGSKCIVSFHDYRGVPKLEELNVILEKEISVGADICKIVTAPKQLSDNLSLLQFTRAASAKAKIVCFGMGEFGKISRLLSPAFGGFFTFASLERGNETAPGQMALSDMQLAYQILGL
jgi:3-dehydroquinate dehydratase type I